MGFFSKIKKIFGSSEPKPEKKQDEELSRDVQPAEEAAAASSAEPGSGPAGEQTSGKQTEDQPAELPSEQAEEKAQEEDEKKAREERTEEAAGELQAAEEGARPVEEPQQPAEESRAQSPESDMPSAETAGEMAGETSEVEVVLTEVVDSTSATVSRSPEEEPGQARTETAETDRAQTEQTGTGTAQAAELESVVVTETVSEMASETVTATVTEPVPSREEDKAADKVQAESTEGDTKKAPQDPSWALFAAPRAQEKAEDKAEEQPAGEPEEQPAAVVTEAVPEAVPETAPETPSEAAPETVTEAPVEAEAASGEAEQKKAEAVSEPAADSAPGTVTEPATEPVIELVAETVTDAAPQTVVAAAVSAATATTAQDEQAADKTTDKDRTESGEGAKPEARHDPWALFAAPRAQETPEEKSADEPAERAEGKAEEQPEAQPADQSADKPEEKAAETPAAKSEDKAEDRADEKSEALAEATEEAEKQGAAGAAVQDSAPATEPVTPADEAVGRETSPEAAETAGEDEEELVIDLGAPLLPEDWEEEKPAEEAVTARAASLSDPIYQELTARLRDAEAKLSVWLDIVLDGVTEAGPVLNDRVRFLLRTLEAPENEAEEFVQDFAGWLERMEYRSLDEFRSELQYRLALALELEDEEDERNRLFLKLTDSLAKTRAQFARHFENLISSHGELDEDFWQELEEVFIMSDLGVEAAMELTERLRNRAREEKVTTSEGARELLRQEIRAIFTRPRHIVGVTPPEVVLMIGVNGAGKTTTIAKLAYRDRMQGKKVMIAAADTFRAAAIDQLRVWAERVGAIFHAKKPGSDPASVAYEAMDRAMNEGVDVLYVDTAGRLQTKVNLMDELSKIRNVIARKHPGAPHRTVLVLDATTGQNALSQAKLFKESAGVDELILTKLDGTAKGGVAIAVAMQHKLPISYVGLGEKVEDLRPFNGDDYADALLKS